MVFKASQKLLMHLEEIKKRIILIESSILKSEKATKKDVEAVSLALKEYRERKTLLLSKLSP